MYLGSPEDIAALSLTTLSFLFPTTPLYLSPSVVVATAKGGGICASAAKPCVCLDHLTALQREVEEG